MFEILLSWISLQAVQMILKINSFLKGQQACIQAKHNALSFFYVDCFLNPLFCTCMSFLVIRWDWLVMSSCIACTKYVHESWVNKPTRLGMFHFPLPSLPIISR